MQVPGLADITINANGYDISCYDKERSWKTIPQESLFFRV
jgi:hypothetical protein